MSKLSSVARHHDRVQEAARKVEELNDSFSKETEEKLQVKIVQSEERLREQRQKQMEQIQTRRNEVQVIILIPSINEMHFHFFSVEKGGGDSGGDAGYCVTIDS